MSQQSLRSASLQKVVPPLFPFISIVSHLLPSFSLTFLTASSSLSPSLLSASLTHLHLFLPTFISSPPSWWWSRGPRPCGRGVPDGLAGRRFRTDPSAADPVLPQPPGGPGGNTILNQDERQRTGEGPGAEGKLRNSRTCHLLHLILKQSEALSLKVPALQSCLKQKRTHTLLSLKCCVTNKKKQPLNSRGRELREEKADRSYYR